MVASTAVGARDDPAHVAHVGVPLRRRVASHRRAELRAVPVDAVPVDAVPVDAVPVDAVPVDAATSGRRGSGTAIDVDQRREAVGTLAGREARFRAVVDSLPVSICEQDWRAARSMLAELRIDAGSDLREHLSGHPETVEALIDSVVLVDVNPWMASVFGGGDARHLLGSLRQRLVLPEAREAMIEQFCALVSGAVACAVELTVLTTDGTPLRRKVTLTFPGADDPCGSVVAAITEPVRFADAHDEHGRPRDQLEARVEDRAEQSAGARRTEETRESLLLFLADNHPAMIGYWDNEQRCRFANARFLAFLGKESAEVIGLTMLELLGQEVYERNQPYVIGALNGQRQLFERPLFKPSGEVMNTTVHYIPHLVAGVQAGFFGTVTDVTSIRTAQAQLDAARRQFEQLFENSPDATMLVDGDGWVHRANKRAFELFSLRPGFLVDGLLGDLVPLERADGGQGWDGSSLRRAAAAEAAESTFAATSSDHRTLRVHMNVASLADDERDLFIVTMRDLSELDQAYRRLEDSNAALEQTTVAQQQFIHIVSHDLREPVNTMVNFCALLTDDYGPQLDAVAGRYLSNVVNSAERMRSLLDDLHAYIRLDRVRSTFAPVPLNDVLIEIAEDLSAALAARRASLHVGALPVVVGQYSLLRVLLQNLIENAVKFSAPDRTPTIRIDALDRGAEVEIQVSDNGLGIPAEHLDGVFDIFRRLHTQRQYPGTGIGLAICRRIVTMHRGRIWAESTRGQGTRVTFTIPRVGTIEA